MISQPATGSNSIYNNESGFTHDYYSGTTALASDPFAASVSQRRHGLPEGP